MQEKKSKKQKMFWALIALLVICNGILICLIYDKNAKLKEYEAQFNGEKIVSEIPEFEIFLPETLYVCTGMTLEIYNSQVTSLGEEISRYNVLWKCDEGENLERKFSLKATGEMEEAYEVSIQIYDNHLQLIKEADSIIKIVKAQKPFLETVGSLTDFSKVPEVCLPQVKICVDTQYNGSFDALKPEGILQMQDMAYAVFCGIGENE